MGQCCAGNIFKQLYEKYGQTFVKLMVAEKGKDVIRDEFGKVQTQAESTFGGFTTNTTNLVDGKLNEVTKIYEDVKNKVNVGGALQIVEKQQGKSIDQISGFTNIKNQINDVKKQTLGKVDQQRNSILTKMVSTKDNMVTKIQQDRPKIQLYEQLPDPLKKVVRDTAETEFSKQLNDNKEQIVKTIAGQFGPEALKQILGPLSPDNALQSIVGGASGQLTEQITKSLGLGNLGNLAGNFGGAGGIGGAFGGVGKFF